MIRSLPLLFFLLFSSLFGAQRISSEPYLTGDTLRSMADHIFDEEIKTLDPKAVKKGDIVFVALYLPYIFENFFKEIHPHITSSYILLSHNGDGSSPGKYRKFLDDPKIYRWFGQNPSISNHPKFEPIPIGLENAHWGREYPKKIEQLTRKKTKKKHLLLGNFSIHTNPKIRQPIYDFFRKVSFCRMPSHMPLTSYLSYVMRSHFVVSPPGNGIDCHRTWEALLLGAYPIVLSSDLDCIYDELPVWIVDDYAHVNRAEICRARKRLSAMKVNREKLYFAYWKTKIINAQKACRRGK